MLVAIDDVQWLDEASARALAFALRRLRRASVLLLLTRRLGEGAFAADVEEALGPDRVDHLRLGPLSMGALQRLLRTRRGTTFPRPLLVRLHEASGGNPFYAIELARALAEEPPVDPTEPLPLPESLEGVARDRLAGLRPATRAALAVVAAGGRASPELLRTAGVADEALEPAFAALVLEARGLAAAEAHAGAALRLAEGVGDDNLRAGARTALSVLRFNAGAPRHTTWPGKRSRSRRRRIDPSNASGPSFALAHVLLWSAQQDPARALLEPLYGELSLRDEVATAEALWYLSLVELGAGRLALAAEHADRQREITRLYASDDQENPLALWVVARIAAHRGELERARSLAERSRALAAGQVQVVAGQEGVLGLVSAWSGQPADAVEHFSVADELRYEVGVRAPGTYWWRGGARRGAARARPVRRRGRAARHVGGRRDAARPRRSPRADDALPPASSPPRRGDVREGTAALEEAVARHEAVGDPFGRARALLAVGTLRRRGRQKRVPREAIEAAVEGFEAIGAAGWAGKARSELGRIGGRVREPGLTAAERRVAALVAEGRTNREVAAALFLGERTVETHFHEVVDDVDLARVLVGFHFLTLDLRGSRLGRRVGEYVAEHYFQPTG